MKHKMGNLKRIFAVLLTVVLAVSMIACSNGSSSGASQNTSSGANQNTPSGASQDTPKTEPASESNPASDTSFPQGNIVITLGNSPGSGGDIFCRALAQAINGNPIMNGYSIVVENRTGASGANAMNYVVGQKPDGYNVLSYTTSLTIAQVINDLPIGHQNFRPLCSVVTDDQMILVRTDSKWETITDLVEDAKANPGTQIWGRGLPSGASTLSQLVFLSTIPGGLDIKPVPFDGGGELITALLGGHVDVATAEYGETRAQIEAGLFRPLCVLAENRLEKLPDVPTAKEMGFDAVLFRPRGFLVPEGTPDEIVAKLEEIFRSALDNEEFVNSLREDATTINWMDSEKFGMVLDDIYQSYIDLGLKELAAAESK